MSGDRIVLSGDADGSAARLVRATARLADAALGAHALIGGLAVMCRLAAVHRTTQDVGTLTETTAPTAVELIASSIAATDHSKANRVIVDGVKADVIDTESFERWLLDGGPEGPRVRIAPLSADDLPFLHATESAPDALLRYRLRGNPAPTSLGDAIQFVMIDKANQRRAGIVALYGIDSAAGHARAAAILAQAYRKAPWIGEGFHLFARYAFRAFPIDKIYGEVPQLNDSEIRGSLGRTFTEEGRLRNHTWCDGQWWDLIYYALTKRAFDELELARPAGSALTNRLCRAGITATQRDHDLRSVHSRGAEDDLPA